MLIIAYSIFHPSLFSWIAPYAFTINLLPPSPVSCLLICNLLSPVSSSFLSSSLSCNLLSFVIFCLLSSPVPCHLLCLVLSCLQSSTVSCHLLSIISCLLSTPVYHLLSLVISCLLSSPVSCHLLPRDIFCLLSSLIFFICYNLSSPVFSNLKSLAISSLFDGTVYVNSNKIIPTVLCVNSLPLFTE